jgi:hypothetical protein
MASLGACSGSSSDKSSDEGSFVLAFCRAFGICAPSSPYVEWKEEVKLNDGRIIVVGQKRLMGLIARVSWLTINLPEFSPQPIVWYEGLLPLVLNIDEGKLYVVGTPPTKIEYRNYGKPRPMYVGFVWENGKWIRIPFEKIPEKIYKANMLIEGFPPPQTKFLTLIQKDGPKMNGDVAEPPDLLKIDPNGPSFD